MISVTVINKTLSSFSYAEQLSFIIKPIMIVSSANLMSGQDSSVDLQSEVYSVKRKGARTVPWGAPVLDVISEDVFPGDGILT